MKNLINQIIAVTSFICIIASFGGFEQDMFGFGGLVIRVAIFSIVMLVSAKEVCNE